MKKGMSKMWMEGEGYRERDRGGGGTEGTTEGERGREGGRKREREGEMIVS